MSFFSSVVNSDIISLFEPEITAGKYVINAEDGKLWNAKELAPQNELHAITPWIFVNNPPAFYCKWQHDIANHCGFIPTHCLNCWKVVVRPRTLAELFLLLQIMEEMVEEDPNILCKCGIEVRKSVFGNYGGYFYHRSMEQMHERLPIIEKAVHERIHPDVECIPKRYCSEFERDFGPTNLYKQPSYVSEMEEIIKRDCHMSEFPFVQSDIIKRKVFREWFRRAWDVGDPTINMFTNGYPLSRPVVRYYPDGDPRKEQWEKENEWIWNNDVEPPFMRPMLDSSGDNDAQLD